MDFVQDQLAQAKSCGFWRWSAPPRVMYRRLIKPGGNYTQPSTTRRELSLAIWARSKCGLRLAS